MTNKIIFIIMMLFMAFQGVYATDVYSGLDFNYEFGSVPQNLEVKVYKCQDSSCSEGKVSQIQTVLYSKDSKSACFKDLTEQQMNNCMSNYEISGDKAPAQGAVVKLTGVTPNTNEYYLVVVSAKDDTYITEHIRHSLNTEFEDYDYYSDFFSRTLTKVFRPKANIQSFYVDNLENPQLPIQVNVEAGMSTTVCSAFNYATNYFKPQFSPGYSDYAAKTDITLEVIDVDTGNVLAQNTKRMNIEASTCSGFHTFEWTPPQQYEDKEIEFKVRTNVVDNQAYLPREDRDSKVVTIYPEDLTNACWVNGNNLVVANKDTRNPQVGDFEITIGEDGFLSFEAEALQSINKDGNNLRYINYRAQISIDGVEIINEVVTSNSGVYKKNIKEELRQFNEGEYEVRAILTPIGVGCSQSETSTLTTLVDLVEQDISTPDTPPVLNTPNVLNGGLNQQVSGIISASDLEDGDLTNQISCISSSSRITLTDNNGVLRITRTTDNSISSVVTCLVIDSDANTVSKNTQVSFGAIQQPDTPPVLNTPSILNGGLNQQVSGTISASDSEDGDLTNQISCSANSNSISISDNNGILKVTRNTDFSILSIVTCSVTDSDGSKVSKNTQIKFDKIEPDTPPVLNTPNSLNGELNQQVQGLISAVDSEDGDLTNQISCNENSASISITDNNGVLQITRTTDNSIYATVTCSVQDSDGNSISENTIVKFTKIEPNTPPVLNTPNSLNGGLNQQVQGPISASDSEDGDLTNQISCSENSPSITINDNNGILKITRTTDNSISATIVCSVQDSDGNSVSENTHVTFTKIEPNTPPTLNTPNTLNGGLNQQIQGTISATDSEDGDLTNQISCSENSASITITDNNGVLQITRNTDDSIYATVTCSVQDSDGNSISENTIVRFTKIEPDTPPVLNTPNTLNGGLNQQVQGSISASDSEDGDLTNQISCTSTSSRILLNDNNGVLQVTRNTDNSIYATIVCSVQDSDGNSVTKNTQVSFDKINPPNLNLPELLNGTSNDDVSGFISAQDSVDGDITNQISCTTTSDDVTVDTNGNSLIVERLTRFAINTTIECDVTNSNGLTTINSTRVVFDLQNDAPQVTITPSTQQGYEVLDVNINVDAFDPNGDDITCSRIINGVMTQQDGSCTNFDLNLSQGVYNIEVVVEDEFDLTGSDSTQINVLNKDPQEVDLRVNPQLIFVGDSVNISYSIVDDAGHVNCILETDNKLLQAIGSGNCVGSFNTTTRYSNTGLYNVTLTTEDKNGNVVTRTEQVRVIENDGPQATLDVSPESGFAPVNGVVNVNATHAQNVSLTCEVTNNGIVVSTSCNDTIDLSSLSKGTYTIEFNVIDGRGEEITLRDSIEVLGEEDKLGNQTIIVDTQSGNNSNVDVTITFANETLAQRVTRFRPSIVCDDGVMNNYENEKWINAALVSRTDMNDVVFDFELFIDDFQLNIDYNEQCTLLVEFRDEYGFVVEKMADITFERPEEELKGIPSIRGQGIDFRNHLTTLLQDSTFEEGYNEFSVILINNEDEFKNVKYTITGQDIFVKESGSYSLEAFEERRVPMNIYVPRGTQKGTYLVKITMDNNGVRESKYTYLRVGENSMLPTYTVEQNKNGYGEDSSISGKRCSTSEC